MTEDTRLTDYLEAADRDGDVEGVEEREDGDTDIDAAAADATDDPDDAEPRRALEDEVEEAADPGDATLESHDADAGEAVEPATTTYAWGTYVCASCGSTAERVWIDGSRDDESNADRDRDADGSEGGLVCESCKDW